MTRTGSLSNWRPARRTGSPSLRAAIWSGRDCPTLACTPWPDLTACKSQPSYQGGSRDRFRLKVPRDEGGYYHFGVSGASASDRGLYVFSIAEDDFPTNPSAPVVAVGQQIIGMIESGFRQRLDRCRADGRPKLPHQGVRQLREHRRPLIYLGTSASQPQFITTTVRSVSTRQSPQGRTPTSITAPTSAYLTGLIESVRWTNAGTSGTLLLPNPTVRSSKPREEDSERTISRLRTSGRSRGCRTNCSGGDGGPLCSWPRPPPWQCGAAGRQPGRTPWQSQPKRQAVHEPTRPTTYRGRPTQTDRLGHILDSQNSVHRIHLCLFISAHQYGSGGPTPTDRSPGSIWSCAAILTVLWPTALGTAVTRSRNPVACGACPCGSRSERWWRCIWGWWRCRRSFGGGSL